MPDKIVEIWYGNRCKLYSGGGDWQWSYRGTVAEAGEYLRMSNGEVWWHPFTGGTPERCKEYEETKGLVA